MFVLENTHLSHQNPVLKWPYPKCKVSKTKRLWPHLLPGLDCRWFADGFNAMCRHGKGFCIPCYKHQTNCMPQPSITIANGNGVRRCKRFTPARGPPACARGVPPSCGAAASAARARASTRPRAKSARTSCFAGYPKKRPGPLQGNNTEEAICFPQTLGNPKEAGKKQRRQKANQKGPFGFNSTFLARLPGWPLQNIPGPIPKNVFKPSVVYLKKTDPGFLDCQVAIVVSICFVCFCFLFFFRALYSRRNSQSCWLKKRFAGGPGLFIQTQLAQFDRAAAEDERWDPTLTSSTFR